MADPRKNNNLSGGSPMENNNNHDNNQIPGLSAADLWRMVSQGENWGGGGPMGGGPGGNNNRGGGGSRGDDSGDSSQGSTESSPNPSRQGGSPRQNQGGEGPRGNNSNHDNNQIPGPTVQALMQQIAEKMQQQALRERLPEQRALQQALQAQSNPANNQIAVPSHVLWNKWHESQQELMRVRSQGQQELEQLQSQNQQVLMELQSQIRHLHAKFQMLRKQYSEALSRERIVEIDAQTARNQRDQAVRASREWELHYKANKDELERDLLQERVYAEELQLTLQETIRQWCEDKDRNKIQGRKGLDLLNGCKLSVDSMHKKMCKLKDERDRAGNVENCEFWRMMSGALNDELPLEKQEVDEDTRKLVEIVETAEELMHALLGEEAQSATSGCRSGLPGLGFKKKGSLDGVDEEMARIRLGSSSSPQLAPSSPKPTSEAPMDEARVGEAPEIHEEPGAKPIDVGTSTRTICTSPSTESSESIAFTGSPPSTRRDQTPPPRVFDWLEETTTPGSDQHCLSPGEMCSGKGEADNPRTSPRGRKRASEEGSPTAKRVKTIDTRLVTDTPRPDEQAGGSTDEPGKSLEPNGPSDQQPGPMPASESVEVADETSPKNGSDASTSSRTHTSSPSTTSGTSSANSDTSVSPVDPVSSTSTLVPPSNVSDGSTTSVPPRPRGRRVPPPPTRKPIERPGRKRASRHARFRGRQRPLRKWRYIRRRKMHSSIPGPWPSAPSLPMVGKQDTAVATRLPMQERGGVRARFMRFMRFLRARPRGVAVAITGLVYTTMMWRNWRTERTWLEANEVPYTISGRIRRTELQMEWFEGLRYDWAAAGGDRSALG